MVPVPSARGSSRFDLDNTADRNVIRTQRSEPKRMTAAELNSPAGEFWCATCEAVWYKKAWHHDPRKFAELSRQPALARQCPACHKTALDLPEGIVTLSSLDKLTKERKEELFALVRNVGDRASKRDPMDRIMKFTDRTIEAQIYTSENQLAVAIGNEVKRAFGGDLNVDFSHRDNDIARVVWIAKEPA